MYMTLSKNRDLENDKIFGRHVNKKGSSKFEGDVALLCFTMFETIFEKMLFFVITNFFLLFSFLFFLFLSSCASTHNVSVNHINQNLEDMKVEYKDIALQPLNWEVNNEKMCLNNAEANKLYDNINNIRTSYYLVLGKYKASVSSFNVLKDVVYGDGGQ